MTINKLLPLLPILFASFALVASGVYVLLPLEGAVGAVISYILLPGVAIYATLNGTLLFGAGFGKFGNYAIIALGSAAVWASLVFAFYRLAAAFSRRSAK